MHTAKREMQIIRARHICHDCGLLFTIAVNCQDTGVFFSGQELLDVKNIKNKFIKANANQNNIQKKITPFLITDSCGGSLVMTLICLQRI